MLFRNALVGRIVEAYDRYDSILERKKIELRQKSQELKEVKESSELQESKGI